MNSSLKSVPQSATMLLGCPAQKIRLSDSTLRHWWALARITAAGLNNRYLLARTYVNYADGCVAIAGIVFRFQAVYADSMIKFSRTRGIS